MHVLLDAPTSSQSLPKEDTGTGASHSLLVGRRPQQWASKVTNVGEDSFPQTQRTLQAPTQRIATRGQGINTER